MARLGIAGAGSGMGTTAVDVPKNIIDQQEELKNWPDDRLVQELQAPSGAAPQYLIFTEVGRRKNVRDKYQAATAEQPQMSMAQEAVMSRMQPPMQPPMQPQMPPSPMGPPPGPGGPPMAPPGPPPMPPQMPPTGPPPMPPGGLGAVQGMAGGGPVRGFANGVRGASGTIALPRRWPSEEEREMKVEPWSGFGLGHPPWNQFPWGLDESIPAGWEALKERAAHSYRDIPSKEELQERLLPSVGTAGYEETTPFQRMMRGLMDEPSEPLFPPAPPEPRPEFDRAWEGGMPVSGMSPLEMASALGLPEDDIRIVGRGEPTMPDPSIVLGRDAAPAVDGTLPLHLRPEFSGESDAGAGVPVRGDTGAELPALVAPVVPPDVPPVVPLVAAPAEQAVQSEGARDIDRIRKLLEGREGGTDDSWKTAAMLQAASSLLKGRTLSEGLSGAFGDTAGLISESEKQDERRRLANIQNQISLAGLSSQERQAEAERKLKSSEGELERESRRDLQELKQIFSGEQSELDRLSKFDLLNNELYARSISQSVRDEAAMDRLIYQLDIQATADDRQAIAKNLSDLNEKLTTTWLSDPSILSPQEIADIEMRIGEQLQAELRRQMAILGKNKRSVKEPGARGGGVVRRVLGRPY